MEMELYQQIKAGNKEVIKNVYKENAKDVYNFAKSITGDHESALEATKKAFVTLFTQIRNDEYPINIRLGAMKIAYDEACSMTMASKSDAESPYNAEYVNKLSFEETASEDTVSAPEGSETAAFGAAAAGAAFAFNNAARYDAPSMNYGEQPVMFDAYGQPVPVMNDPYGQQAAYPMNYDAPGYVTQDINGNVFYNAPQNQAFNQAQGAFNPYNNNNQLYAQAPAAFSSLPEGNSGAVNPAVNNMFYNNGANVYGQPFNNGTNMAFGGQPAQFNGGQPVNFPAQPMMYNNAGQPIQPMNYGAQPMMYNNAGQPVQPMNYGAQPMIHNNAGQPIQPMNYGAQPMMYNNAGQPLQPMNYGAQPMMYNNVLRPEQPLNSGSQGMMYNNAVQSGQPADADTQAADNNAQPVINPFMSNAAMAAAAASVMSTDEEGSSVQQDSDESIPESVGSMFYTENPEADTAVSENSDQSSEDNTEAPSEENTSSIIAAGIAAAAAASAAASARSSSFNKEDSTSDTESDKDTDVEGNDDEMSVGSFPAVGTARIDIPEEDKAAGPEAHIDEITLSDTESAESAAEELTADATATDTAAVESGASAIAGISAAALSLTDTASEEALASESSENIEDDISYLDIETGQTTDESESAENTDNAGEPDKDTENTELSEKSEASETLTNSEDTAPDDSAEDAVEPVKRRRSKGAFVACLVIVIILVLLLIWFLCGLLINLGVIPQYFDLGYTWFNQNIYPLF